MAFKWLTANTFVFWASLGEGFKLLLLHFVSCSRALCISFCSENGSSSGLLTPAAIAQQSQDKQVPVLWLFSVSEVCNWTAHSFTFLQSSWKVENISFYSTQHTKWKIVQWHQPKRDEETQEFCFDFFVYIWAQICPQALGLYLWFAKAVKSWMKAWLDNARSKDVFLISVWK